MNEYETYQVGDKPIYVEFPFKAAVEILEKFYAEPGEGGSGSNDLLFFKVRLTKIYTQFPRRTMVVGEEFTVSINVTFTGWCSGLWRFRPLEEDEGTDVS